MSKLKFLVTTETTPDGDLPVQLGRFSRGWKGEEAMDRIQEELDQGRISRRQALLQARRLEAKRPDCLELQNFIANRLWDEQLKDEATEVWARAFQKASAIIPAKFRGQIPWAEIDNRPFLRIAHGQLLGLMHRGVGTDADRLADQLLAWCPADNLGVRFLQADIKLLLGDRKRALELYLAAGDSQPESWYQAGRLAFQEGEFVRACSYIRRGIAANPYIAEALTGRVLLQDHLYWHSSSAHGAEWAIGYVNRTQAWTDEECDFVDWLFNCSAVLKLRASLMEAAEGLTYEREPAKRTPFIGRHAQLVRAITDLSSEALIRRVRNPWGQEVWPWDRAGLRRRVTSVAAEAKQH